MLLIFILYENMRNHNLKINVREYQRAIKKGQSRETGNIRYTRWRQTKQKHNTICVWHHYTQTNTNYINKTWAILQTTRGKDEPNIYILTEILLLPVYDP